MSNSSSGVIPEIFQQHLDSYQFLWRQWQDARGSPDFTLRDLARLEARMEAHLDGLLVAGENVAPMLEPSLSGDDRAAALAAAYVLLAMGRDEFAAKVLDAFRGAQGPALEGIRDALCLGNVTRVLPQLRELFTSSPAPIAVAAAEVLAFHDRLEAASARAAGFLTHDDPAVRRAAWRVASLLDSGSRARP